MKFVEQALAVCVCLGAIHSAQPVYAEYVGFSVPVFGGSEIGYDFDGTNGVFSGTWYSGGPSSNGYAFIVEPLYNSFGLDPSYPPVPWSIYQPSIAHEGFDWDMCFWVTNYIGQVSGLSSGEIVTVFFLYKTTAEHMGVILDGETVTTLTLSEEAELPTRLMRYGWSTNGVPTGMPARVIGIAVRAKRSTLDFELAPLSSLTNTPPVELYGVLLDTVNASAIDNDEDGAPDWQELVAGTLPFDSNSVFRITSFTPANMSDAYVLSWSSATSRSYQLTVYTNLLGADPGTALTNMVASPPLNMITVTVENATTVFFSVDVDN
jgi:hypothetical protein